MEFQQGLGSQIPKISVFDQPRALAAARAAARRVFMLAITPPRFPGFHRRDVARRSSSRCASLAHQLRLLSSSIHPLWNSSGHRLGVRNGAMHAVETLPSSPRSPSCAACPAGDQCRIIQHPRSAGWRRSSASAPSTAVDLPAPSLAAFVHRCTRRDAGARPGSARATRSSRSGHSATLAASPSAPRTFKAYAQGAAYFPERPQICHTGCHSAGWNSATASLPYRLPLPL